MCRTDNFLQNNQLYDMNVENDIRRVENKTFIVLIILIIMFSYLVCFTITTVVRELDGL